MSILLAQAPESRATKQTLGHPSSLSYWINKLFYGGGGETASGVDVTPDSALTFSAYWRAVDLLSGIIGFLPLKHYQHIPAGKEELTDSAVGHLMAYRPNPYIDARVFRKTLTGHKIGWGNGYAEIERNKAGRPIALWPLPPDKVEPKVIGEGQSRRVVYEYTASDRTFTIEADDVLHIQGLGFDGLKGYSMISYAAESLGVGMAADRYSAAFFGNGAMPAGGLRVPEPLDKEAKEAVREEWDRKYGGLDNKHRIAILDGGLDFTPFSVPAKDAQLIESRKFSIGDCSRWTGIPPHMLFELDKGTYSNNEELGNEFKTYSLQDTMRAWELPCTLKLCARPGVQFFEFVADALLRGNTKDRYEAYNLAIQAGWMNRQEPRRRENLNAGPPELDEFLQPLNMVVAGQAPDDEPDDDDPAAGINDEGNTRGDFSALIESTWRRIVTKDVKALRKAPSDSAQLALWLDAHYRKLSEHITDCLTPILQARGVAEPADAAAAIAYRYCTEHRRQLGDGSDRSLWPEVLASWDTGAPQAQRQLMEAANDG